MYELVEERQKQKQEQHQQRKRFTIFPVDEGHNSKETASKYRNNFNLFLDYIKIHSGGIQREKMSQFSAIELNRSIRFYIHNTSVIPFY
jgi:hypothetical protein